MQIKGFINHNNEIIPSGEYRDKYFRYKNKHKNKLLYITLSRKYKKRSIPENNYYWGCIVTPLAEHFGYTPEEMHETLKWMFLRIEEPGKPPRIRSTASEDFTTKDAEEYYEKIRIWALREYGIKLQLPNEER